MKKSPSQQLTAEKFRSKLSSYQLFVLLSIFIDILFIFTIQSFHYQKELNKLVDEEGVMDHQKDSFSTWKTIFTVGIVVRILLFCGGGATIGSGYTSYLGSYNSSTF